MKKVTCLALVICVRGFAPRRSRSARFSPLPSDVVQLASTETVFDFDTMKAFETRLDTLELAAPDTLYDYYEPHLKSFSLKPGGATVRLRHEVIASYSEFTMFIDFVAVSGSALRVPAIHC